MIVAFVRYCFKPTLKNWRALRRVCMAKLPAKEQAAQRVAEAANRGPTMETLS